MNNDNPAARLLKILEMGKKIPGHTACIEAWRQLLGPVDSDAMLMARLGKAMELPDQIIQALKDGFPNQGNTWSHWAAQVNQGFMVQNVRGHWETFLNNVDAHSITYLKLASDLIQTKANTTLIANDRLFEVRESIRVIYDEVLESEMPDEIRKYLVRYLRLILVGIDEYHLTGALPLLDAIEMTVGHSAVDKAYHSFLQDTEIGKRILDTLGAMANVVTVAVGIPQLSQAIALLS